MRHDRLPSLLWAHLLKCLPDFIRVPGIPVLMFHSISTQIEETHPYYKLNTSPEVFRQQMNYLKTHEYKILTIGELIKNENSKHDRRVCITFDDGYQDFYTEAFPILQDLGFKAVMYLPVKYIGGSFKKKPCLTWPQIEELIESGIEFGSHTYSHPFLATLEEKELREELYKSKDIIEQNLGQPVSSFSHPFAFPESDLIYTRRFKTILQSAGYASGVTTIIGRVKKSDDRHLLKRLPVNNCDDPDLFEAKLRGGYDWLHMVQYIRKKIKRSNSETSASGQ